MANLKNITELPVAESAEGLNLIVNDNGRAKQIAASAVGAQADWSVTDENSPAFIKNKPEQVQPDWSQNDPTKPDYVKNRTHYDARKYETVTLTFDGNLNGKDIIELIPGESYVVKVSDEPINAQDVIGGTFEYTADGNVDETLAIVEDMIEPIVDTAFSIANSIFVANEDFTPPEGLSLPKGVWFTCILADGEVSYCIRMLEYTKTTGELKKLDAKFLPDGVGGYEPSIVIRVTTNGNGMGIVTTSDMVVESGSEEQVRTALANGKATNAKVIIDHSAAENDAYIAELSAITTVGSDSIQICALKPNINDISSLTFTVKGTSISNYKLRTIS